jgi:YcaO-like protein with predicted kinase domain
MKIFPSQAWSAATSRKHYFAGTHRICDPRETVQRILPRLGYFGITRVANVTGLDRIGIPVVTVVRPNSRSLAVSQGKGLTLDAARASGIMEAIELQHAENIRKPLQLASWEELSRRTRTVDPRQLPPSKRNAFHPWRRMLWIEGFDLLADAPTWLPLELVTTDTAGPELPGAGGFCSTSNGLASGNHPIEAICHALCELVERDAATLWRLRDKATQQVSRLDLASVGDSAAVALLEQLGRAEIEPIVWELTSDIGVAAFLCLLCERGNKPERARYASTGMGCHPTREVALLRAFTEAAQSRLTLITGTREDVFRDEYEWNGYRVADLEYYRALHPQIGSWRRFAQGPDFHSDTVSEDLEWLLARLRAAGFDSVVVVDLSEPGDEVAVVRVVVPGLEAYNLAPDYAPGERARRLKECAA